MTLLVSIPPTPPPPSPLCVHRLSLSLLSDLNAHTHTQTRARARTHILKDHSVYVPLLLPPTCSFRTCLIPQLSTPTYALGTLLVSWSSPFPTEPRTPEEAPPPTPSATKRGKGAADFQLATDSLPDSSRPSEKRARVKVEASS